MRSMRILAVAVLAVVLALSAAQNAFASTEIAYDNGTQSYACSLVGLGPTRDTLAVLFSLPSGWSSATLSGAEVNALVTAAFAVTIHVETSPGLDDLMTPLSTTLSSSGWHTYSLTGTKTITGQFYIAIYSTDPGGRLGGASGNDATHSYGGPLAGPWYGNSNPVCASGVSYMIRALVDPVAGGPGQPVGGFIQPVNKLVVFAPYLALFGVIGAIAVVYWKRPDN